MSSVPLNLGPNPRRRESFSNSYKPFEGVAGSHPDGRPIATNLVVENVTVADDAIVEDDEVGAVPAQPPRAFVRGNRSFSQSNRTEPPATRPQGQQIPGKDAGTMEMGQQNASKTNGHTNQSTSPEMAKSPMEGGWWYGGIKEF